MLRDSARTSALVAHLHTCGILATGLNYPVVPKGDQEIRFQVNADHTPGRHRRSARCAEKLSRLNRESSADHLIIAL